MKYYTVYLAANDELIASGSSVKCAKAMGLKSIQSFYDLVSKAIRGRRKKYEVLVENWRDVEEGE